MFSNQLLPFPTVTGLSSVSWDDENVVSDQPSEFTLQNEVQVYPGQLWRGVVRIRDLITREQAMPWVVFLKKLRGKSGTFFFGDPLGKVPRGVATGTPQVDGAGQTGNQLLTKSWTPNVTGIFMAGDYFQMATGADTRLYMNLTDVDSDASGKATLDLWPEIRGDKIPADSDPLIVSNPQGLFRLDVNTTSLKISAPTVYNGYSFPIREAI
jgi:hypothetical protein